MILLLATVHENDAVIPLLAKEGPGVLDCWATTPYPLLLRRRGAIFMAARNLALSPFKTMRDSSPCGPKPSGLRPPKGSSPQEGDGASLAAWNDGPEAFLRSL